MINVLKDCHPETEFAYNNKLLDIDSFIRSIRNEMVSYINSLKHDPYAGVTSFDIFDGQVSIYLVRNVNDFIELISHFIDSSVWLFNRANSTNGYLWYLLCYGKELALLLASDMGDMIKLVSKIFYYPYMKYWNGNEDYIIVTNIFMNAIIAVIKDNREEFGEYATKWEKYPVTVYKKMRNGTI